MMRVATSQRRYWLIAVLGSVAFHVAILFVPMPIGVPAKIERAASVLQVALRLSGPISDWKVPRASAPPIQELMPVSAPALIDEPPLIDEPSHAPVPEPKATIESTPAPVPTALPTVFSRTLGEQSTAFSRISESDAARSGPAETSPSVSAACVPIVQSYSSPIASTAPLPEELPSYHTAAPPTQNYFKDARNLFAPTTDSFVSTAVATDLHESQYISPSKPASPETPPSKTAPAEAALPSVESTIFIAAPVGLVPKAQEPAPTIALPQGSAQVLNSSMSTVSSMEPSTSSSKEITDGNHLHSYFSNSEIFITKTPVAQAGAAQESNRTTSSGMTTPGPSLAKSGGVIDEKGRADGSLSSSTLKSEMRVAKVLHPFSAFKDSPIPNASPTPISAQEGIEVPKAGDERVKSPHPEVAIAEFTSEQPRPSPLEPTSAQLQQAQPEAPTEEFLAEPIEKRAVAEPEGKASEPLKTIDSAVASAPRFDTVEILASRVIAELTARKTYPAAALRRKTEGTVTLLLSVEKDGRLASAVIQSRSGSAILDEAALTLARGIFPIDINLAAPVSLVVPIEYRIPK